MDGVVLVLFLTRMYAVAEVPPQYALATWVAAETHEVDPNQLGALLITEHGSAWDITKRSSRGATGLFQVMPLWARHFDVEVEALDDPFVNADIAAQIVIYSQGRHADCKGSHDWRAHYKCGSGGRDRCEGPVKPVMKVEHQLRQLDPGHHLRTAARRFYGLLGGSSTDG